MRVATAYLAALLGVATPVALPVAVAGALPVDCLPEAIVHWQAAPPAESRFGHTSLPGIVLGPPGDSPPTAGSTSVASLGHGGSVEIDLGDIAIENGPGPDFIVFENAFFVGAPPADQSADYQVFAEPGFVDVSQDGTTWTRFPYDAQALAEAAGANIDRDLHLRLKGLAGITPTFAGDWNVPDDPAVWDATGTGGVSGAGGDAFDLADVGLADARFLRIVDANSQNGVAGSAEGFDLDAVVVLHGRVRIAPSSDRDGDRLPDLAEERLYGTDPDVADSDGDGVEDGRELAGCTDPNAASPSPFWHREPRLWLAGGGCTELRWTFVGSGETVDAVRGNTANLFAAASSVDLGATDCLGSALQGVRWACDSDRPVLGDAFFYVVRRSGETAYGMSSDLLPRETAVDCP